MNRRTFMVRAASAGAVAALVYKTGTGSATLVKVPIAINATTFGYVQVPEELLTTEYRSELEAVRTSAREKLNEYKLSRASSGTYA